MASFLTGARYSSLDPFALTNQQPQVLIPSTTIILFYTVGFDPAFVLDCEKYENETK